MVAFDAVPAPPPSEPRVAHYLFAHRAVPRAFLRNPAAILPILASEQGMEFLSGMWDVIEKELEPEHHIDHSGLKLEMFELKSEIWLALVTMPAPHRVFEAYFVACATRLEGDDTFARAFSLDLAGPPGPDADTGILEWDTEGKHELLEPRCAPEASAFVDTLEKMLVPTPPP